MKFSLLLPVLVLVLARSARADTVQFVYGFPLVESTTEIDQDGVLGLFDSNLGTLTGAQLEVFGASTTTISLTNTAVTTVTARAVSTLEVLWTSTLPQLDSLLQTQGDRINLNFPTGPLAVFAPGQTRSYPNIRDAVSNPYNLFSILAAVQAAGGGTFSLNASTLSNLTIIGGGGNVAGLQSTTAGAAARITYTYTAVPEPGLGTLLVMAAIGVAAGRRR
jgi:hypothetical protein